MSSQCNSWKWIGNAGSARSCYDNNAGRGGAPAVFGLQINWSKTKILQIPPSMPCSTVQVADGHVEMVDAFVYLGSMIDSCGGAAEVMIGSESDWHS